jgi:hypothetical protein
MRNYTIVPSPWGQVILALLPGLLMLLAPRFYAQESLNNWYRLLLLAALLLLIVSSVLPAVLHRRPFKVEVWGLIPLGMLAGVLIMLGWMIVIGTLDAYSVCFVLLAVTGLLFARAHGMSVGLFVLTGGIMTAQTNIEPGMYLGSSPEARFITGDGLFLLFWMLTPLVVLRARSALGQAMGLLVPMVAYAVAFVYALSSASGLAQPYLQFSISQSISIARPIITLFLIVALSALVYAGVYARDYSKGKAWRESTA